jgi:type II secretory pathway pseudopilin PulG
MKVRREYIIAILIVGLIFAAVGAAYQFFYKARLAQYDANTQALQNLENALTALETQFESKIPEDLIKARKGMVQPLAEQVVQRAAFFNTAELLQIDPIPEGKLLRFYYSDQFNKMLNELRQDAYSRTPYCAYPEMSTFGAPRPDELEGRTVTEQEVKDWLSLIKFGATMMRMLMDAKAVAVYDVQMWPERQDYDNLLKMRTVGLSFVMRYGDLVAWLDKLRLENRYFDVNGIGVQNRYLRWAIEPPVEVQMLLTQADFNAAGATSVPRAAAPGGSPLPGPGGVIGAPGLGLPFPPLSDAQRLAQGGFQRRGGGPAMLPPSRWRTVRNWLRNHWLWPF